MQKFKAAAYDEAVPRAFHNPWDQTEPDAAIALQRGRPSPGKREAKSRGDWRCPPSF